MSQIQLQNPDYDTMQDMTVCEIVAVINGKSHLLGHATAVGSDIDTSFASSVLSNGTIAVPDFYPMIQVTLQARIIEAWHEAFNSSFIAGNYAEAFINNETIRVLHW